MTYTVTANCEKCKYTDCVEVCPVEAFHEGPDMLYINRKPALIVMPALKNVPWKQFMQMWMFRKNGKVTLH